MDDNYIRNKGANSDKGCYVQSTCIEMEISVKNQIDMLIFHTAICAAGVTK